MRGNDAGPRVCARTGTMLRNRVVLFLQPDLHIKHGAHGIGCDRPLFEPGTH